MPPNRAGVMLHRRYRALGAPLPIPHIVAKQILQSKRMDALTISKQRKALGHVLRKTWEQSVYPVQGRPRTRPDPYFSIQRSSLKSVQFVLCTIAFATIPALVSDVYALEGESTVQRVIGTLPPLALPADTSATPDVLPALGLFAPAPGLSSIQVYAVGSTSCGWEYTAGSGTTSCNHGGGELRVAVIEIGYGSNPIAWMNGGQLPNSARYASTGICITGTQYTWPCKPGQTVVGWLNEYNVDGRESGVFKYQNTSTNPPHNTLSAQINIL